MDSLFTKILGRATGVTLKKKERDKLSSWLMTFKVLNMAEIGGNLNLCCELLIAPKRVIHRGTTRGHWKHRIYQSLHSSNMYIIIAYIFFSSVQSLSHVQLFATLWTATYQASLSVTNSWSLLKLMSIKLVMPSNYLTLCCPFPLLPSVFPASEAFPINQFFTSGGQSIGVLASASIFPVIFRIDLL